MNGRYVYVLFNDIMYKCVGDQSVSEMLMNNGFIFFQFFGNIVVIKICFGYVSSMVYDIDNCEFDIILGIIVGDDIIMLVLCEGVMFIVV